MTGTDTVARLVQRTLEQELYPGSWKLSPAVRGRGRGLPAEVIVRCFCDSVWIVTPAGIPAGGQIGWGDCACRPRPESILLDGWAAMGVGSAP